ncbi:MAG: SRPBCC domain-containing protein [Acidimicrobiales bacterium]
MTETDPEERRSIEIEIEVPGTPEEVWRAIATGPGISSWYVPHVVEEREGGAAVASFGPEPEMQAPGRVAAWEPPRRVVFDGGDQDEGLAFEWLIEARDGGTCIVRLVNSGFMVGGEWDDHYDGMTEGWAIFLANLRLHLERFAGRSATASLPMATWAGPRDQAWARLTSELGVPAHPAVGERIEARAAGTAGLAGEVVEVTPHRVSLVVDSPAPGTAFIAAEGRGDGIEVSVWRYLYGEPGAAAIEHDELAWREWLGARSAK